MKARAFSRCGFVVAAVLFTSLAVAQAKTIRVDADGGADFRTIKPAVDAAQSGDTIIVEAGIYGGDGVLDIVLAGKVLTIQSTDPSDPEVVAATVIDCQAKDDHGHRFIEISRDTGAQLTLAGLKMINSSLGYAGGIVLCEGADLHLLNCTFSDNSVEWWGGAIDCEDSNVTIEGCTFARNTSTAGHGGAVASQNSVLALTSCTFRRNTGNALELIESVVTIVGCTFTNNSSNRDGGAIYAFSGGGKDITAYLDLTDCIFSDNYDAESGGALHNRGVEASIAACSFTNNRAGGNGGAVYIRQCAPTIDSCIFISNTAVGVGGAIANYHSSAATIINSTVVKNKAASGGGVSSRRDSEPLISHCILWDNEAGTGANVYLGRDPVGIPYATKGTVEYSDVKGGRAGVYTDSGCILTWGEGNLDADPLFRGAVYDDYRLDADSVCIDAGAPDYIPSPKATDLDGRARQFGKAVDLGAYEQQGLDPVYRFWAPSIGRPFYTIEEWERNAVINLYPDFWQFKGIAFYAHQRDIGGSVVPVYRLWSVKLFSHVWTTSQAERSRLLRNTAEAWSDEGVVFYAFDATNPPLGTQPVHRLRSSQGRHFFTIDEAEKDSLLKNTPGRWTYEGVAFYAYATSFRPEQASYTLTGGEEEASLTLTLAAYVDGQAARIDDPTIRFGIDSARMRLGADFTALTATLEEAHVSGQATEHTTTIRQSGASGITIPFTISGQVAFAALSVRGPFRLDLSTGRFADYSGDPQFLPGDKETFTWSGTAGLSDQKVTFTQTLDAEELELSSYGQFKALNAFSENVTVSLPETFQWRRPNVRDVLIETTANKRRVQIFITDVEVVTQGQWEGMAVN